MRKIIPLLLLLTFGSSQGLDLGVGVRYNKTGFSPFATVAESYKTGKFGIAAKVEKVVSSPLAMQLTASYPVGKGFSAYVFEKLGVDPSFEPVSSLTGVGLDKKLDDFSLNFGPSLLVANHKALLCTSFAGSYRLGDSKLGFNAVITPTNLGASFVKAGYEYRLSK